ncbi:MAG: NUDIX domain-containing protein [Clostridia bacterium]|nr:NUDIX domain-containing protein [Clostridia bacterium]
MNLICKLTDTDIGEEYTGVDNPKIRLGARGIVIREDGKIAIFNKTNKNEFKLPGGGIETGENPEEAFKREVLEETGCTIEIIEELGTTEEYKSKLNFKQISNIFYGKVIEDTQKLNFTNKEKDEGAKLLWVEPQNALELITNCYDELKESNYESVYATRFVVLRDRLILKYYIDNYSK